MQEYSISYGCFTCPSWNGTGCSLTACCMIKMHVHVDGRAEEIGEYNENN